MAESTNNNKPSGRAIRRKSVTTINKAVTLFNFVPIIRPKIDDDDDSMSPYHLVKPHPSIGVLDDDNKITNSETNIEDKSPMKSSMKCQHYFSPQIKKMKRNSILETLEKKRHLINIQPILKA